MPPVTIISNIHSLEPIEIDFRKMSDGQRRSTDLVWFSEVHFFYKLYASTMPIRLNPILNSCKTFTLEMSPFQIVELTVHVFLDLSRLKH